MLPGGPVPVDAGAVKRRVGKNGTVNHRAVRYWVDFYRAFEQVLVTVTEDRTIIADLEGTVIREYPKPAPGVEYMGKTEKLY